VLSKSGPTGAELSRIESHFEDLVGRVTAKTVVMDRFRGTAVLRAPDGEAIGTLGVVARASGLARDARAAHPFVDLGSRFSPVVEEGGDVLARFWVRVHEVRASLRLLAVLVGAVERLEVVAPAPSRQAGSGLGIVEGWRGTIVHRLEPDAAGRLTRCKIVDPSFLDWPALSVALADTIVGDFPLANKSFGLSYAGNDL